MIQDLTNQKFGRLTVIERQGSDKWGSAIWACRCECGNPKTVPASYLKSGHTQSCGCLSDESRKTSSLRHGRAGTTEYKTYIGAKNRCENPKATKFHLWGGRGIQFRFTSFEEFYTELGERPSSQHSLDRYPDNNGHYEPGNVRWATSKEQANNRRERNAALKTNSAFSR